MITYPICSALGRKKEPRTTNKTQRTNESLRPEWRGTGAPRAPATVPGGGEGHKRGEPGVGGVRVLGCDGRCRGFSRGGRVLPGRSCGRLVCLLPCLHLLELSCLDFSGRPCSVLGLGESAIAVAVQNGRIGWRAGSKKNLDSYTLHRRVLLLIIFIKSHLSSACY